MNKYAALDQFRPIIKLYTEEFPLDEKLVLSIIWRESAADPLAIRFEPNYSYTFKVNEIASRFKTDPVTESNMQKCSFGLMQVMGGVARELGFEKKYLTEMLDANINIFYGMKKLHRLSKTYKDIRDVISSYNAGSVRKDGQYYRNQNYVDYVLKVWSEL